MEKKVTSNVTKGIILSLVLIVVNLIAGFANVQFTTWFRWIPSLILAAGLIWACMSYGTQNNAHVTFGDVFAHGFKTSAVVACIVLVFSIISIYFIFPDTKDQYLEVARKQMEDKGTYSQDAIDQGIEFSKKLFLPFAIAGVILGTIFVGLLASLIGAAVTKKVPVSPFDTQS